MRLGPSKSTRRGAPGARAIERTQERHAPAHSGPCWRDTMRHALSADARGPNGARRIPRPTHHGRGREARHIARQGRARGSRVVGGGLADEIAAPTAASSLIVPAQKGAQSGERELKGCFGRGVGAARVRISAPM